MCSSFLASAVAIVTDDWDSWNESSLPLIQMIISSWNTSGYNTFTLTAGLSVWKVLMNFK